MKEINRRILCVAVALILVAVLATPLISIVGATNVTETDMGDYREYVGTLGGANFVVRIPKEGWNGMLVVGCHGYMMNWHANAQFAMDNLLLGGGVGLPFTLVEQGFAYAASSYGEGGFPIKEAMIRTHQLAEYVIDNFGVTGKVFIIGHSMGGAIGLLLGEKYPELYDGVLDISAMRNTTLGYLSMVGIINNPPPGIPPQMLSLMVQLVADMEVQFGGTYDDKPKAYERLNPSSNAKISIPVVTVYGTADPLSPPMQVASYGIAVDAAGCSEYYRVYGAIGGGHADPPTINAALSHFEELVDYPVGW